MGQYILVVDTETTTNEAQRLKFGSFRYAHIEGTTISTLAEGLIYADDLPATDPQGYARLADYAATHSPDVDVRFKDREPNLEMELLSRDEFARRWLWHACYVHKELLVGFNLPFDLTRLAVDASEARGDYEDGFSLTMYRNLDGSVNTFRPRLRVNIINSKASFISYAKQNDLPYFAGRFLDLRTLAFALTSGSHSLETACQAYGVEHGKITAEQHGVIDTGYIDYCRRDVQATTELYAALTDDYATHDLAVPPERIYSPASIAKAYLTSMGIPRPLETRNVRPEILGYAMSAFYGARTECHIRRQPMPVAQLDYTSMYPTVNTLMGMWRILTAQRVDVRHARNRVQKLLNTVTLDTCFDPATWSHVVGIAKIRPQGDILPVRAKYNGKSWNIGVNYCTTDEELWYAIPDLVASVILTGQVPEVLDAIIFQPVGVASNLHPVMLRGAVPVDPATDDFFRLIIEERAKHKGTATAAFLKVLANAGCYGIFAELNKRSRTTGVVYSYADRPLGRNQKPESPGPYTWPIISSVITAAARLMLAMLERCVTDQGGTWVFTDTDSMAVVCSEDTSERHGVRPLRPVDVQEIRQRFNKLNPYENISDLLKLEYEGMCYAISAKRYALFHRDDAGKVVIDKASEHGLGHLMNPVDPDSEDRSWIAGLWQYIIATELELDPSEPTWLDRPATSRYSITQTSLWRTFAALNEGRNYAESVKPANFIIVAHATKLQLSYRHAVPVAPYDPDSRQWKRMQWRNKRNPSESFTVDTLDEFTVLSPGVLYVRSYRDVLQAYGVHTEDKSQQPNGAPCTADYRGELHRRHVRGTGTTYLGRESNQLELVSRGLVDASEATRQRNIENWKRTAQLITPVLQRFSLSALHNMSGIPRSTLGHIRSGTRQPWRGHAETLLRLACTVAADELGQRYIPGKSDPAALLTQWRDKFVTRDTA